MNLKTWTPKHYLTAVVWAGAFKVSASHAVSTAMEFGNSRGDALTYPVLIDAVIIACALWVASSKGVNKATKIWAGIGRIFGFIATLGTNLAHADLTAHGTAVIMVAVTVFVSLLPGIAVIIMTEVFVHGMKSTPAARAKASQSTKRTDNVVPIRKAN